jgi:hypothetical protein
MRVICLITEILSVCQERFCFLEFFWLVDWLVGRAGGRAVGRAVGRSVGWLFVWIVIYLVTFYLVGLELVRGEKA